MTDEIRRTLSERKKAYGEFAYNAYIARSLKLFVANHSIPDVPAQAMSVIMDKLARLISGDPWHRDTWLDIQGYAQLVMDHIDADGGRS